MIDDDVDDVDVTHSQEKSGGVQIRVNTTCRNYGGVRTPRTPMDRRHWLVVVVSARFSVHYVPL